MAENKQEFENLKGKKIYEQPFFKEEKGMDFPEEVWEEFNGGKWCFGCSNCNCN